jgi:thymidylate synthase (FAD)
MQVTLLDHTTDPEARIGSMAAICYDANTEREASIRRAAHCKDSGHLATLRFAYATFNVSGISRVCSHQIVRMAHAGILQRSQRYVKETNVEFVVPECVRDLPPELYDKWAGILARSRDLYLACIDAGMKKEDARYILPQGCSTELNLCLNFQGWHDFLKNRADKAAQWEVRDVAFEIRRQLGRIAPNLFGGTSNG